MLPRQILVAALTVLPSLLARRRFDPSKFRAKIHMYTCALQPACAGAWSAGCPHGAMLENKCARIYFDVASSC
jgi:hypothetical protein